MFTQEVFKDQTVVLNSSAVQTLNIGLSGVDSKHWIEEATKQTEDFIAQRKKKLKKWLQFS